MAGTPKFKVFNSQGEYVAACKYGEESAMLAACMGEGTTVRLGHSKSDTVWTEGREKFSAGESYDEAARIMEQRVEAIWNAVRP